MEKLYEIFEKYWLKLASSIVAAIILVAAYIAIVSTLKDWSIITPDKECLLRLAQPFALLWGIYFIACLVNLIVFRVKNRLPKAPKGTVAVLFCIDAESAKLYDTASYKLVNNFKSTIKNVGAVQFHALCIPQKRFAKYNLQQKDDALAVLQRTNCALLVRVRYTADDLDNAENFELKIDYGVRHPAFNESARQMLAHDMSALGAPVGKQRFTKAETIDVFNFTTQTLICACQYVFGMVALLASDNLTACALLSQSKKTAISEFYHAQCVDKLITMIDDRIYAALCQLASEYLIRFKLDKSVAALGEMRRILLLANEIRPDTYFYNLNMAYAYIILDQDATSAKNCVAKCRLSKEKTSWMYSEAFLSAYSNLTPGTIISKYQKALNTPYENLLELVEYIEFIIEREPDKTALHLAAGLVYEDLGDQKLMKYHFSAYIEQVKHLDRRIREKLESKMQSIPCGIQCEYNCIDCTHLMA